MILIEHKTVYRSELCHRTVLQGVNASNFVLGKINCYIVIER